MAGEPTGITNTVMPGSGNYGNDVVQTGDRIAVVDGNGTMTTATPAMQRAVADYQNASGTLAQISNDLGGSHNQFPGGDAVAFQARYSQYDLSKVLGPYDDYAKTRDAVVQDIAFRTEDLQPRIRAMADAAVNGQNTNVAVSESDSHHHGVTVGRTGATLEI